MINKTEKLCVKRICIITLIIICLLAKTILHLLSIIFRFLKHQSKRLRLKTKKILIIASSTMSYLSEK